MESEQACFKALPRQPGFYTLGRFVYRYRKLTIAFWAVLMVLSLAAAPQLEHALEETGSVYEAGSAHQAEQLLQQDLNLSADTLTLVFQRLPNEKFESYKPGRKQPQLEALLKQIRALPEVSGVDSATEHPDYRSADGHVQYSVIRLAVSNASDTLPLIERIEQILTQPLPGWKSYLTGMPVVNRDVQQISKTDLGRIEFLVLPLTLMALLIVFGSVMAAILPVVMAVVAVSITLGLLYLIALHLSVSVFALNMVSMLGLGLGIDYSLLIVNRFREELGVGTMESAIAHTVETAGRAVFFSGLTVCIGLMGLLLFPITLLQSLGIAGSLVVLLSVMVALTLLPALLALLGQRVQRRAVMKFATRRDCWTTIARTVIRHCIPATLAVLVLVGGLSTPFLQARFGLTSADILPKSFGARTGAEVLAQAFGPGAISPILVLVRTPSPSDTILAKSHLATLYKTVQQLTADPRVEQVSSLFLNPKLPLEAYQQLYQESQQSPSALTAIVKAPGSDSLLVLKSQQAGRNAMKTAKELQTLPLDEVRLDGMPLTGMQTWVTGRASSLIVVQSRTARNTVATQTLVKEIQAWKLEGLQVWVAGQTARELDTMQAIEQRLPFVIAIMMGVTFVVLYALLQSVILPLKAIVMNVLSIGASFGALVFIFQEGNLQRWLHFTPVGYIDLLLPIVLFCMLFGLSMDYEVFMLTRIKEAYDEGKSNTESVIEGLRLTGSIITSAALLMIIVTSAFVLSRLIFVKALGLGCAMAVLIDVTLIRAVLVPATMNLMGKWNWWSPRW